LLLRVPFPLFSQIPPGGGIGPSRARALFSDRRKKMPGVERRVKRGWMNLLVKRIIQETHDTRTLILVDEKSGSREFDYIPGQYLTFRFDHISEKPVVRSYTMSSAPVEGDFSAVTVKEVEDGFVSRYLCRAV